MLKLNYEYVISESKFKNINAIYFSLQEELCSNGVSDYDILKSEFIKFIRYIVNSKIAVIEFRTWVDIHEQLDNSDLETQLSYIYKSFPTEYDENVPEKDIDNLWWYTECPVDVGWLKDDGEYWFS
ncbi:DUF596 domain-containing protein [Rodentibacter trehalosifermentans]|uniref:DUF596 domain-containing protein n=1 Tax=Rodentibacter trehalosifermentans TaxID=1908263 RepID=A0A1V3IXJ9_9PAST|nr:DUF596 domain-containing protein [Rodentibacter trehalosifermentans]OOF46830.1 hypothetical protein BKK52_10705 [Rodentibacter trehalosifermentans]OOF46841.1 hypothetical protein BKK51_01115 [Rodentibacter trehalosifermentans]OOF52594.1 hypothetical protein BKK53_04575 [Rodentibacter trehalosifermentans]